LGSSICIYLYGSDIKRILPLKNDYINEDWISNRSRYFFEAFFKWRVNIPLIKKNKKLAYASWKKCFYFFFIKLW
jgi:NADH-quinone oxidoreductase subunit G